MTVVGVEEFGGPDQLRTFEMTAPDAGRGEIRIRVASAAVSPADLGFRAGGRAAAMGGRTPPHVPGMDAAGVVDQVGEGADFTVGDRVMAIVSPFDSPTGAYAEYVVVPAAQAVVIPDDLDFDAAAALPMSGMTAALAVEWLGLTAGQTVAVTGSAGIVGGYAIALAKADGLVVVADAAPADEELVRSLGADHVAARGADYAANVRALFPDGVDGLIDAANLSVAADHAIRDGGRLALVKARDTEAGRGITQNWVYVTGSAGRTELLTRLRDLVASGAITVRVAGTFDKTEAAAAHRALEAGGTRGRLILHF
jgi:NADPH:quinone reductase-like Zn-dependent oxidoreductase